MSTYETAQDQFIIVNGIRYAYRRFGLTTGIPLFLHIHFRGTMDHWDPAFINPLAEHRPIIILDNAGVGRSEGNIPMAFTAWAQVVIDVLTALGVKQIDLLGFSMGGCTAQLIALNAPHLVRRLILAATISSTGEGVVHVQGMEPFMKLKSASTKNEQLEAFLLSFFGPSERSQAAGKASFERIHSARPNRVDYIDVETAERQTVAYFNFQKPENEDAGSYNRFLELEMPVLIANGSDDLLLPTENSYVMWKKLSNTDAQLHLYPDSGHGFLYQYANQFTKLINNFLDAEISAAGKSRL
ncbi:alpha/beta-hydrolase [Lindgomyces ingoldianus]|uniref:Alpha/beta-hydrolase n=1 Tax=Lindgomyces ingoldianus TaxID=673940 RepID=A0ACB6R7G3_9PLEO|nr:alpha/beta-hydrolase [Lindgomyces ingoldianus]KAF2474462.1 alpha/beta-hydrolase [Lindgomyces ingoldianus]